jgi:hypothetical protein
VKTLANKPFALIGVNSDPDRDALQEVLKKEQITWRSFWDRGQDGRIAKAWHVNAWPTLYIIDDRGILRAQAQNKEEMVLAVSLLLRKIKKKTHEDTVAADDAGESKDEPRTSRKPAAKAVAADKAERQAETKLEFARSLAEAGKRDKARSRLKEVMDRYPGTLAAEQAKELLDKLAKDG